MDDEGTKTFVDFGTSNERVFRRDMAQQVRKRAEGEAAQAAYDRKVAEYEAAQRRYTEDLRQAGITDALYRPHVLGLDPANPATTWGPTLTYSPGRTT